MLAKGNGRPELCVLNLLRITRGEVPYERIKGRDGALVDNPSGPALTAAVADAEWLIETYEPRMQTDSIDIDGTLSQLGDFCITGHLKRREED